AQGASQQARNTPQQQGGLAGRGAGSHALKEIRGAASRVLARALHACYSGSVRAPDRAAPYSSGDSHRAARSPSFLSHDRRRQSARCISVDFSRSSWKACSRVAAVTGQRISRSHSALNRKERKSRFVEPTTETRPSATRVLEWRMAAWYSKIRTPPSSSAP